MCVAYDPVFKLRVTTFSAVPSGEVLQAGGTPHVRVLSVLRTCVLLFFEMTQKRCILTRQQA